MQSRIHVVIPMSGQGSRFVAAGYTRPKPLIPVNGTPMIERLLQCYPQQWQCHFVLSAAHRDSGLAELLTELRPSSFVYFIEPHTRGPGFAIKDQLGSIPKDAPVLVSYCDFGMSWDPAAFENFVTVSECDACVISYRGFHAHYLSNTNYAFSRMEGERVVEIKEKANFTNDRENEFASAGAYYFKTRALLEESLEWQIQNKMDLNGELYISLTVQALLKKNPSAEVRVFEVPSFFQWGTPQDLQDFEYWEKTFKSFCGPRGIEKGEIAQILMPMAGHGTRFQSLTSRPKPLLPVAGKFLFLKALESLPKAPKNIFVVRAENLADFAGAGVPGHFLSVNTVPSGQALSTEVGLSALDMDQEVIVSTCDHGIAAPLSRWMKLRSSNLDAAVFAVRGFPGARRNPTAYSYVSTEKNGEFPRIRNISLKKPISVEGTQNHFEESVLIGTFWFRSGQILSEGIAALKKADHRVNGELYLDEVLKPLLENGYRVGAFEVDGYMNWGDPESLKEALYWEEVFSGHRLEKRSPFPGVDF